MIDVRLDGSAWEGVEAGTEALLEKWLVKEGDTVEPKQPLASVVLVKTTMEVTAPESGAGAGRHFRVAALLVPEGETFGPGRVLARLEPAG